MPVAHHTVCLLHTVLGALPQSSIVDKARVTDSINGRQIVVLLVDDQPFVGAAIRRLLATEPDITLHCCSQATEAVARANEVAPAVILQDLMMPGLDGLSLVGLFRANPATARTPRSPISSRPRTAPNPIMSAPSW